MKKFVAIAGALALSACGGGDEAAVDTAATDTTTEVADVATDSALVGAYGGTGEDGQAWTSTINADGSYVDTVGGEVTETGGWTETGDQVCFDPEVMEGETANQTCMTLVNVNDDGSLALLSAEGEEMTVQKLAE